MHEFPKIANRAVSDALIGEGEGRMARLVEIMRRLRAPDGCPWDLEQDFASIAPYTIEEAYEVADAIARADMEDLRDELGDLLLQAVFHAQMAEEAGAFTLADIIESISEKMLRRHPHVFGDVEEALDGTTVKANWEVIKAEERAGKGRTDSALDGVALALPALMRAEKLQKRAARIGFDWPDTGSVIDKIAEEARELADEVERTDPARIEEEYGDLLFVMANLARHLGLDPERALTRANLKFETRFRAMEQRIVADGREPQDLTLEELDAVWSQVKQQE